MSDATTKKPASEIDGSAWTSAGHPPIDTLPMPRASLQQAWRARTRQAGQGQRADSDSMKIPEFSDFVRSLPSQARDEDDLWALAETQKAAGDRRLHTFMMSRRDVAQILERTEKAEAAPLKVKRKAKNRVEILEQVVSDGRCSCSVEDQWLKSADEVAAYNGYENRELQSAILDALERGIFSSAHHALLFPIKPTRNLTAVLFL